MECHTGWVRCPPIAPSHLHATQDEGFMEMFEAVNVDDIVRANLRHHDESPRHIVKRRYYKEVVDGTLEVQGASDHIYRMHEALKQKAGLTESGNFGPRTKTFTFGGELVDIDPEFDDEIDWGPGDGGDGDDGDAPARASAEVRRPAYAESALPRAVTSYAPAVKSARSHTTHGRGNAAEATEKSPPRSDKGSLPGADSPLQRATTVFVGGSGHVLLNQRGGATGLTRERSLYCDSARRCCWIVVGSLALEGDGWRELPNVGALPVPYVCRRGGKTG